MAGSAGGDFGFFLTFLFFVLRMVSLPLQSVAGLLMSNETAEGRPDDGPDDAPPDAVDGGAVAVDGATQAPRAAAIPEESGAPEIDEQV